MSWEQVDDSKLIANIVHQTKEAWRYLKQQGLQLLPVYLMIGESGSGKTNLLAHAQLGLNSIAGNTLNKILTTEGVTWWFNDEKIFIDTSGKLLEGFLDNKKTNSAWNALIKQLRRFRIQLQGVIVAVDINQFQKFNSEKKRAHINSLYQRLEMMTDRLKQFAPVYVLFTKADNIVGFIDFFSELCIEDKEQCLGISFPTRQQQQDMPHVLDEKYSQLLQQINQQLIWRLHQEHNRDRRARIKDFPLQLEQLKKTVRDFVLNLYHPKILLRGIYFTSSLQDGKTSNLLLPAISKNFNVQKSLQPISLLNQQSYFIKEIFHQIIGNKIEDYPSLKVKSEQNWFKPAMYATSLGIVLIGSFTLLSGYWYNIQEISNLKNAKTDDLVKNQKDPWLGKLFFQQANQLKLSINHEIGTHLKPIMQQTIEFALKRPDKNHPETLYAALEVYLMLSDRQHFDKEVVASWLSQHWKLAKDNHLNERNIQQLLQLLIRDRELPIHPNLNLIQAARQILNQTDLLQLIFISFQNEYDKQTLNVTPKIKIPSIYSAVEFNQIYHQIVPQISRKYLTSDWVLAQKSTGKSKNQKLLQLSNKVRMLYLERYKEAWEQAIDSFKMPEIENLNQARNILSQLSETNSSLIDLLDRLKTNTQFNTNVDAFHKVVADKFNSLANVDPKPLVLAFKNAQAYITPITSSDLALKMAQERMLEKGESDPLTGLNDLSQKMPEPLKSWIEQLSGQTWKVILSSAQEAINQAWQNQVLPPYQRQIANRYPFFPEASTSVSLSAFNNFFSPRGTISRFFDDYLKPFVNTSQLYFTWQSVDDQHLNIDLQKLAMFNLASIIQKMFYSNNINSAQFSFTLLPLNFSSNLAHASLDLFGETINYTQGEEQETSKNYHFTWPEQANTSDAIDLTVIDNQGKTMSVKEKGLWAIFKLLEKGQLQTAENTNIYQLTFNVKQEKAEFEIITDQLINPLLPNIIQAFRCPEEL